jgi:hypothetical protein
MMGGGGAHLAERNDLDTTMVWTSQTEMGGKNGGSKHCLKSGMQLSKPRYGHSLGDMPGWSLKGLRGMTVDEDYHSHAWVLMLCIMQSRRI